MLAHRREGALVAAVRSKLGGSPPRGGPRSEEAGIPGKTPMPEKAEDRPRRVWRRLGNVLLVLGAIAIIYSSVVLFWGDPVTGLYARWRQHQLSAELDKIFSSYSGQVNAPPARLRSDANRLAAYESAIVGDEARKFSGTLELGQPLGRIAIPRIGVNVVFVQGTRWGPDLSQGPGHYVQTSVPGLGRTVAIAGHRTTFGAWFRHIDELRAGDQIVLRLPYATFHYRVFGHQVVPSNDWHIIHDRGFDALVLSACHPLYSASHRWIVFAALYEVDPVKGTPYLVNMQNEPRPVSSPGP
jgi:sortase A